MRASAALRALGAALLAPAALAAHPKGNWYDGLPNVKVLRPGDEGNQELVDGIFKKQKDAHFDTGRYAILLTPGSYKQPFGIDVGYYTSVIGVGRNASDVQLGRITSHNGANGHATNNFWRSFEGVTLWNPEIVWAVSQAAPIRRSVIKGNLHLSHKQKYSSGGFMADVSVHGKLHMGTQQQWFFRNTDVWGGMACPAGWNYVFVGMRGLSAEAQQGCSGDTPAKVISVPQPFAAEKPFLVTEDDAWHIHVPKFVSNVSGPIGTLIEKKLALEEEVFVARPGMSAEDINKGTRGMKGLLVTPGIYELKSPIEIKESGFVVLGIGLPTLVSLRGFPAVQVADDVHHVRVAGLLLEAGTPLRKEPTAPLLLWGQRVSRNYTLPGPPSGLISDVFVRVGSFKYRGCKLVRADMMMQINSDDVVLDHVWLWHADHDDCGTELEAPGRSDRCHSQHGLEVNGRRVLSYGLAAEHTVDGHMVLWNGEEGDVYFYQSEVPYHQPDWGAKGYVGYAVSPEVEVHTAHGIGVYIISSMLKGNVRSAFLLPKFAQAYGLFNVTIGGANQFSNLACVQNSGTCYKPESCTPMRCWRSAFPTKPLPPAKLKEMAHAKVVAKQDIAWQAVVKRREEEEEERRREERERREALAKKKALEEKKKALRRKEEEEEEARSDAREEARGREGEKPSRLDVSHAREEIVRDQVLARARPEHNMKPPAKAPAEDSALALDTRLPGPARAALLCALPAVGLLALGVFAARQLLRRPAGKPELLPSEDVDDERPTVRGS